MDFSRFNKYKVNLAKNEPSNSKNGVFGDSDHAKTSGVVVPIKIEDIETNPEQARSFMNTDSFYNLKESIKREGLHSPIVLFKDRTMKKYVVKAGHRRLRAVTELGYTRVDCIVLTDKVEATFAAISTNEFHESIHPIDKGVEVESLIREFKENKMNVSLKDIARFYGVEESTVKEWRQYANIDSSVRAEITKRNIRSKDFLRRATKVCKKVNSLDADDDEKKKTLNLLIQDMLLNEGTQHSEVVEERNILLDGPNIRNFLYYDKSKDEFIIRNVVDKLSDEDKARLKEKTKELLDRL